MGKQTCSYWIVGRDDIDESLVIVSHYRNQADWNDDRCNEATDCKLESLHNIDPQRPQLSLKLGETVAFIAAKNCSPRITLA